MGLGKQTIAIYLYVILIQGFPKSNLLQNIRHDSKNIIQKPSAPSLLPSLKGKGEEKGKRGYDQCFLNHVVSTQDNTLILSLQRMIVYLVKLPQPIFSIRSVQFLNRNIGLALSKTQILLKQGSKGFRSLHRREIY